MNMNNQDTQPKTASTSRTLLYADEVYKIIGAAMDIYNTMKSDYLEAVYQEALEVELGWRNIPFVSQKDISIQYKGHILKKTYLADFLIYDKIIVEIKALDRLTSRETSQVLNYLHATGMRLGLLINFGSLMEMKWERLIL